MLILVLVVKDSLRTFFKSLSLSWSLVSGPCPCPGPWGSGLCPCPGPWGSGPCPGPYSLGVRSLLTSLIFKRLLHPYVFDLILHLTNIIISISEYCIGGNTCFAVARGEPLMLFDQISKHCWWRGCIPCIPNGGTAPEPSCKIDVGQ